MNKSKSNHYDGPRIIKLLLLALFLLPVALLAQPTVDTEETIPVYDINESFNFIFSGLSGSTVADIFYDKTQAGNPVPLLDDQTVNNGSTFNYSHPEPGVVLCDIFNASQQGSTPDEQVRAALIDPFSIDPFTAEPSNPTFEEHWDAVIDDIPTTSNPLYINLPVASPQPNSNLNYTSYELNFEYEDNKFISGFLMVPNDLQANEKVPTIVRLPAYTSTAIPNGNTFLDIAKKVRAIAIHMNAHPDGQSPGYTSGADNLEDRNTYHYKESVAGIIRAIDYIESQTSIYNGKLALFGESQGGGLSLLVAGIDDRVDGICISAPAICEHKGRMIGKASGFPDYIQKGINAGDDQNLVLNAASYYDAALAAKRIEVPCFAQIGHEDQISPSATSLAAVNQIRGSIHMTHGFNHGHTHGFGGFYGDASVMFLERALNGFTDESSNTLTYLYADAGPSTLNATANAPETFNGYIGENEGNYTGAVLWESIEGPASPTIVNETSYNPTITFPQNGTYLIRFSADPLFIQQATDIYYTAFDYVTVTVGAGGSCNPSFSTSNLTVNSAAGNSDISVSGISPGWTVNSSSPSWLTVNNQNDNNIDISYTENTSSNSRTATITVTCNNGAQSNPITITQSGVVTGNCTLVPINAGMFFNPDGTPANSSTLYGQALGDEQANIGNPVAGETNSNLSTSWQYPWVANAQTYIELPQSYNLQKIWIIDGWGSGTFTVAEGLPSDNNPPFYTLVTDEGQGYIHEYEIPGGLQTQYLTFTKVSTSAKVVEIALCAASGNNPTCSPTFGTNNLNVSSTAGNSDISVSGINPGWTVTSSSPSWLSVNNQNDNNIDISYTENTSSNSRTATITVTCDNGVQSSQITVTQAGGNTPTCNPTFSTSNLTVNSSAGNSDISVSGISSGWTVTSSSPSWLTVNNQSDNNIDISYTENTSTNSRTATITVTCDNGIQSNPITVTQSGVATGACALVPIDASMFFNPDGTPANGNVSTGQALGDEQANLGTLVGGQTNSNLTTTWQYPWVANAQTYIELPQSYNLQKIWIVDGWGTGTFTVAEGLPSDNNPPFYTLITDEGQGYIHEYDIPGGLQTQYLTFTKVGTSAKVVEIALCAASGNNPTCNPSFGTSNLNVSSSAGNSDISVNGVNPGWTVTSSNPSWLTVANQNDNNIDVSYTANSGSSTRSATITLTCDNGVQSSPITVTQSGTSSQDDLEVTVTPSQSNITPSTVFTSSLKIKNTTSSAISGITADCLNMNYNHSSGSGNAFTLQNSGTLNESHGSYNWWTAQWNIGTLQAGEEATIDFQFKIKSGSSCTANILMETTASESSNDYVGSNTVDCASSFTSSTSDDLKEVQSKVLVFPNPASNTLQVSISDFELQESNLVITDQLGKRVLEHTQLVKTDNNTYDLDISTLPAGVYFLHFNNTQKNKKESSVKFVKIRL